MIANYTQLAIIVLDLKEFEDKIFKIEQKTQNFPAIQYAFWPKVWQNFLHRVLSVIFVSILAVCEKQGYIMHPIVNKLM